MKKSAMLIGAAALSLVFAQAAMADPSLSQMKEIGEAELVSGTSLCSAEGDGGYYLENLEVKEAADRKVPDSVFFLLDTERDRLLGAINIRHYLNDDLRKEGGHIGDGIRPSERRKGYATEMIRLALIECRKLGIDKVLMTCDKDNIGSAKAIINNGGILENEFINSDGEIEQRYWITICN